MRQLDVYYVCFHLQYKISNAVNFVSIKSFYLELTVIQINSRNSFASMSYHIPFRISILDTLMLIETEIEP